MRSLTLLLAAATLPACLSDDDVVHDGDATLQLGAIEHHVGAIFTETDGFLNFVLIPGANAAEGTGSGTPVIQFSLAYDKDTTDLRSPGLSNLTIAEGDQRLIVIEAGRNTLQEVYAIDGFVLPRSHSAGRTDGERVMHQAGGVIEVTLEDGRTLTGEFSAVRSE